jgi:hypothetical protein
MATVTLPQISRPDNLHAWQAREYQQAYTEDQQRHGSTTASQPIIRWAYFHEEHGQAWRDSAGACWFLADDSTTRILLHNEDAPALQLHGLVDVGTQQQILDERRGGLVGVATSRRQEG